MSKIALGTVQFGINYGINSANGKVTSNEVDKILRYAKSCNIDLLDTAPAYGDSEQILGNSYSESFKIVTKTRHFECDQITHREVEFLVKDLHRSLKLLNRQSVYGVLIHNVNDLFKIGADKFFYKLQKLKQQGLIDKIGVSIYDHSQLKKVLDSFDVDLIQLPFNIIDRRLIESGMLKLLNEKSIEVHARSVFLQGLLLMNKDDVPHKFSKWSGLWNIWHEWLKDNNISALEASIRFAVSNKDISKVLVGIDSKDQLQEIIIASNGSLPEIPPELFTNDIDLLNPSQWGKL